jgi:hypothetical protein
MALEYFRFGEAIHSQIEPMVLNFKSNNRDLLDGNGYFVFKYFSLIKKSDNILGKYLYCNI